MSFETNEKKAARILIVDDELIIAGHLQKKVEQSGHEVLGIARNSEEALSFVRKEEPDLILMDIKLEGNIDGITTAEIISSFADVPVIFLTAFTDAETIKRVKKISHYGYFIKPVDEWELIIGIETSLYKHSMDKKLKREEFRFRTVANFTYDWEYWVLPNRKIEYTSPSCERVTGYKAEEFYADPDLISRIIHTDDKPKFLAHTNLNRGENEFDAVENLELRIIHKSGDIKILSHICRPIIDEKHKYLGRRISNRDITERKRAEGLLAQSEKDYRNMFQNAHDEILIFDPDGEIILDANDRALEVYGYSKDEFLGMSIRDISKYPLVGDEKIENTLREGYIRNFETVQYRKDGSELFLEVNASVIEYKGKKVILSLNHDITLQKRNEEALRESEELFRSIFEQAPVGMLTVKPDGHFLQVNESLCRMFGYTKDEFKILTVEDITHPDDLKSSVDWVCQLLNNEKTIIDMENRYIHKSGNVIWGLVRALLKRDIDGSPQYFITHVQDITERKAAEQKLQESITKLESAQEVAKIGFWNLDLVSMELIWSEGLRLIFELEPEEPTPTFEQFWTFVYHKDITFVQEQVKKQFEIMETPVITYQYRILTKKGKIIYIEHIGRQITNSDNKLIMIYGSVQDITERKRIEAILLESEQKMRIIIEGTPYLFFYIQDAEANNIYVSPTVKQITGYEPEIWLKRKDWFITSNEINQIARARTLAHLRGELTEGAIFIEMSHAKGKTISLEVFEKPIIADNKVIGLQGVAHDITARKKAEEVFKDKVDELERFNNLTVGRELKMIELKKEINSLLTKLGLKEKYKIDE